MDASPGLGRLGSSAGTTTWAVRTPLTDGSTSSRARDGRGVADGQLLGVDKHGAVPTDELPAGTDEVSIDVGAGHLGWKLLQASALVVALYLALPTERRPDPAEEAEPR